MKKTYTKNWLIVCTSSLLMIYGYIYACSDYGDDWGWGFDSNFTPETFVDESYTPLNLSLDVFYKIGYDNQHNTRFDDEILTDWKQYLGHEMKPQMVQHFLKDSSLVDVEILNNFFNVNRTNPVANKWRSKIDIVGKKTKEFITFLYFAKKIEAFSTDSSSWYYEKTPVKTLNDADLIKLLENKFQTATSDFVRNRYWFQIIKAHFYSTDPSRAIAFFEKTAFTVPKNTLYYRALSYVAGIEYRQKNYVKSNYLYSIVFDKCPKLRVVAAYCFHPQNQEDFFGSLKMAKNAKEKAALWAVAGYYGDEINAVENIYKLDPHNVHLDYLLSRLINIQEQHLKVDYATKNLSENKQAIHQIINAKAYQLVLKIADENNISKPYMWQMAAGYLATLNENYSLANGLLDKASQNIPQTTLAKNQLRLLRFVNQLSSINELNPEKEASIIADLNWLYFELPKQNIENFRYQKASQWSKNYVSALFKQQNNHVMAELFNRQTPFYDDAQQLQNMKIFMEKLQKTDLEKIGEQIYTVNFSDINEYQAVQATWDNRIQEAIDLMQHAINKKDIAFLANPFNGNIKDCHDCDFNAYQKKKYSQLAFLNLIKTMQTNLTKKQDVYTNALLLGNAFYNISYYGNGRIFYEGNINGTGSAPYDFRDNIKKRIINTNLAQKYYELAFINAKTDEQKAKCQYLLAKCERNDYYNQKYYYIDKWWEVKEDNIHFLAWKGFQNLKTNYAHTAYYKEVIAECGYFVTYLKL